MTSSNQRTLLMLAAQGVVGKRPGLVVRVRPVTEFERRTWAHCPEDGLRLMIDEDGRSIGNAALSDLPDALFVSSREWQSVLRDALRKRAVRQFAKGVGHE